MSGGRRFFSAPSSGREYELSVAKQIETALGGPDVCRVGIMDKSGGCGTAYEIQVETAQFEGKSRVARERMVQETIRDEIKKWHSVQIRCLLPEKP